MYGGNSLIRSDAGNLAIDYASDLNIINLLQKASKVMLGKHFWFY